VEVTNVFWGSNPADPSAAHPGDTNVQMNIVITNVGDDVARGVNVTLYFGPPISYTYFLGETEYSADSVSKIAGDMPAGQSFVVNFPVSIDANAKEGIYRYNLAIAYKSARELQPIDKIVKVDIPVWKGQLHVQNVATAPLKIYPDSKQVVVKVGIVNSGQGAAKNVRVLLDLRSPFTASSSGSDEIFLGNIPAGQVVEADFVVDVASTAIFGQYDLTIGQETDSKLIPFGQIPLYINEKVKFEVVSVNPTTVHSGDSGDVIRVEIRNAGSVKADSVRVQLRVGNFFTGTLTDFLGTMLAGETKVAFFTIDIDSKAQPGNYSLDLRFDWTQEENSLNDTLPLPLEVQAPGPPIALIIVAVVVVVGGGGYMLLRRRRAKVAAQASAK